MKARLEFFYQSKEEAEKVAYLLEIDNRATPINVKTKNIANRVITEIEHGNLPTLLATIEDVIFCEAIIDRIIKVIEGENRNAGHKSHKRKSRDS